MHVQDTTLPDAKLVIPRVFPDDRGFFAETFRESALAEVGIHDQWIQDNHSRSRKGIVRGMHFSLGEGQAKLVRCGRGQILDVVVDLRRASPTYGQWEGHVLDDESLKQLYIPVGFAHGFCVLSDVADVIYKCSSYYDPAVERGFRFDDPDVGIAWPQDLELDVSERDRTAPLLREIAADLPF